MDTYKTKQVGDLLGISPQTVKNWTAEFAEFLSPAATPEKGQARNFTASDLEIFALVAEMRNKRHPARDIFATLRAGERGEIPPIPYRLPAITPTQLGKLQLRIGDLETHLQELALEKAQIEGALERSDRELSEAREQIDKLNQHIGKLEALLEIERQKT